MASFFRTRVYSSNSMIAFLANYDIMFYFTLHLMYTTLVSTHRSVLWLGKVKIPREKPSNIAHVEILVGIRETADSLFTHVGKNLKHNKIINYI